MPGMTDQHLKHKVRELYNYLGWKDLWRTSVSTPSNRREVEGRGYFPSSKQAQLKLFRAFVIQNTCFVVGIHLVVGGTQPVHSGRNKNSNKRNLKIRFGLFWDF